MRETKKRCDEYKNQVGGVMYMSGVTLGQRITGG